ncbi:MAG: hypothetical protein IJZ85_00175 [Lachnospiraceae bacterium]|nr:hypothetical protein [Lachnospiraceae bacterium]
MNDELMGTLSVNRNYKDSVFRMIFREKETLLTLYNALNGTGYTDPEELEINTLENAIYLGRRNDISFVIFDQINLYEHQSTVNANMPLRNLFYISSLYTKLTHGKNIYSDRQIMIPAPHFVTFYNGTQDQPESQILRLSDAYEATAAGGKDETPELELTVKMININRGHNEKLLNDCKALQEYMVYVERVRAYAPIMSLRQAVERAVDECIREGVLAEFLRKNRAEVVNMSIFEYNQEEHFRQIAEEKMSEGMAKGMAKGMATAVISLLKEHGELSQTIVDRITDEKNLDRLNNWLKVASKVETIEEFMAKM